MTRDQLKQMSYGALRLLASDVDAELAEKRGEARVEFETRLAALREEFGMPDRAPVKRRRKKAQRKTDSDKAIANGVSA